MTIALNQSECMRRHSMQRTNRRPDGDRSPVYDDRHILGLEYGSHLERLNL